LFNVLGHAVFGFEQSVLQPLVAVGSAYGTELLLEYIDGQLNRRPPRFAGGVRKLVDSLLSAHITGLAVAMLLYASDRLLPFAFAASTAIASKAVLRAPLGKVSIHFLNPSNFGISLTLLLLSWVGIAPPYHFTENLSGIGDWILPAVIVASGTFLNARFTHRLPLIAAWLSAFVLQAAVRSLLHGTPLVAALLPMTAVAFILFTFYMITDPATTPEDPRAQIVFGVSTAAAYGLLVSAHVVFGLFFGLTIVCVGRGLMMHARALAVSRAGVHGVRARAPRGRPEIAAAFVPAHAVRVPIAATAVSDATHAHQPFSVDTVPR
jgi:hypothetical protein